MGVTNCPALGQDAGDLAARLADQADQFAGLIGRDAAADDEKDAFAKHGWGLEEGKR
jgi:hypothetical protein